MLLYRIVRTNPPMPADFRSNQARGRPFPPRGNAEMRRLWDGLSAWDSEDLARWTGRAYPSAGSFIVALDVLDGGSVRFERTRGPGHYTLWGEPFALMACVVAAMPV